MKLALIDYGAGNTTSVKRAFERLGATSVSATDAAALTEADALVLPGVGHYAALIRALDERGFREALLDAIGRGVPFLGICLGLQALYESSEEASQLRGLNVVPGDVQALPSHVKLPHMGWNQLRVKRPSRLLEGVDSQAHFYFAHSYAALSGKTDVDVVATCAYGGEFTAVLEKQNVCAVQFHPEKSGSAGTRVLGNFLRLAA